MQMLTAKINKSLLLLRRRRRNSTSGQNEESRRQSWRTDKKINLPALRISINFLFFCQLLPNYRWSWNWICCAATSRSGQIGCAIVGAQFARFSSASRAHWFVHLVWWFAGQVWKRSFNDKELETASPTPRGFEVGAGSGRSTGWVSRVALLSLSQLRHKAATSLIKLDGGRRRRRVGFRVGCGASR